MEIATQILYHGSNAAVKNPRVQSSGFNKDFGFGFYCTKMEKQAERWALTKHGQHIVSSYSYSPNSDLNVKIFPEMTDEWLDFVAACRSGLPHEYDIVEGPMADDTVWDYVEDYLSGSISREAFWALAKFKYPTHQIVFCSDKALTCLHYETCKEYDE